MTKRSAGAPGLIQTGVAGLDDILRGGVTPCRLYLVEGDPGSGKTTLGLQFLLEGKRRGETGIYVSLSETREELLAIAESHGLSLEGITITELAPTEESLAPEAENTMFHPAELELADTTKAVLSEVDRIKPDRVVFDSLSEMRLLAQNPLRYRRQILALKQFFSGRRCTVMLLDDRTSTAHDLQLQSIAHGVINLERRSPDYGVIQRRLQVVKMRGQDFRAGYHDFVIRPGGLQVFPRLVAAEHHEPFEQDTVKSGLPALDTIMGGGLDRGTSTLLIGPAGSGKSTFALQYGTQMASSGGRAAFFMFDESPRTMQARAKALGIGLQGLVDSGRIVLRQIDPGELSAGEFISLVRDEVEKKGARMIVIDSLSGYLQAIPDVRYLALQLHELLSYLGQKGVTSILVLAQAGMIGMNMKSTVDASYLADSVVLLRYFEAGGRVRQALSVLKKRSGQHERSIREFSFGPDGIHVGEPLVDFEGILTGVPRYKGGAEQLHGSPE
jgi:circadian clock protein KaiC